MSENTQDTSQEVLPDLAELVATLRAELAQCKAEHAQETAFRIATEGFANKADAERDASQELAERYREALERERDNHKRCIDRVQALNAQEDAIANAVHAACTELGLDVWNVGIPERVTMLCGKAKYYQKKAELLEQDLGVLRNVRDEVTTVTTERDKAIKRAEAAEKGWADTVQLLNTTISTAAVEHAEVAARVEALTDERDKVKAEYQRIKADLGDHAIEAMRIARDRDAAIARAEKAEETERRWMQTGTEIDVRVADLEYELHEARAKASSMEALADERRDQVVRQAEYIRVLKHEVDAVREVLTAERKRADAAEATSAKMFEGTGIMIEILKQFRKNRAKWSKEHDATHEHGELAQAAAAYALAYCFESGGAIQVQNKLGSEGPVYPWDEGAPVNRVEDPRVLIHAGALILAELERIEARNAAKEVPHG